MITRTLALGATLAAILSSPASAQYYRDPPPPPPGYGYGYPPPPPPEGYGYRRDDEFRRAYGRGPGYDRPRFGDVCLTSRGSCPTGRPLPHATPCACEIPGFGYKRGAVE